MDNKKVVGVLMLVLLFTSLLVYAQEEDPADSCTGFWRSISCFLFGNPENRAGRGWVDRGKAMDP